MEFCSLHSNDQVCEYNFYLSCYKSCSLLVKMNEGDCYNFVKRMNIFEIYFKMNFDM